MIPLSLGGTVTREVDGPADSLFAATVEGVLLVLQDARAGCRLPKRGLDGVSLRWLNRLDDGATIAGTHGMGVVRSGHERDTWRLCNHGPSHTDIWIVKCERLHGRERLFAGSLPVHLFVSDDSDASWRQLAALRDAPSAALWRLPPPPHIAHLKRSKRWATSCISALRLALRCARTMRGRHSPIRPSIPMPATSTYTKLLSMRSVPAGLSRQRAGTSSAAKAAAPVGRKVFRSRAGLSCSLGHATRMAPSCCSSPMARAGRPAGTRLGHSRARTARSRDGELT